MRNASVSSLSGPSGQRERSDSCASTSSSGSGTICTAPVSKTFTISDIVKTGHLHIKRPPTTGSVKIRIKTWQKRYLVLRDQSYLKGSACLEIYTTDTGWQESKAPNQDCFHVDLTTVTHVDEYTESKNYPHAFTITRRGHGPLVLGAESEYDLKEWMVAIQVLSDKVKVDPASDNNNVKDTTATQQTSPVRRPSCPPRLTHWGSAQHIHDDTNGTEHGTEGGIRLLKIPGTSNSSPDCLVTIHPTEDSLSQELSGDYLMVILKDEIFLRRPGTIAEVISWKIVHILKFKSEDESDGMNLLTLEASSQSGRSAGKYLFRTNHGRRIIQKVKDVVAQQEVAPAAPERTHDKELERLRARPLCKMPSTPNLMSRGSPPKSSSRLAPPEVPGPSITRTEYADISPGCRRASDGPILVAPEVPARQRKISDIAHKPNAYLDLTGDIPPPDDAEAAPIVPESRHTPKSSPCPRRKISRLPPLPPGATDRVSAPDPTSTSSQESSHDRPSPPRHGSTADIPPARPPRKISRSPPQIIRSSHPGGKSPPPPPPRPQHTLGTKSVLV